MINSNFVKNEWESRYGDIKEVPNQIFIFAAQIYLPIFFYVFKKPKKLINSIYLK